MLPQFSHNQTNNQFQHSSRVVIQTRLSQAAMVGLHLPSLRAMVGHHHHHNQTMVLLQMQLHRLVQVLYMVVQPLLSSQAVMVVDLEAQVNNLAMDHLLQHSSQVTLHPLPQDHNRVAMDQGPDRLAMAPLGHRQIMEQWLSHLHKLDRVWVTMLMSVVELGAIVTNPNSSSNQDMEEQMQEVVAMLLLLLPVEVVATVVEEEAEHPLLDLSLVHMYLQQHKPSLSNHHHNKIRAVTATRQVLDQDLVYMDLQVPHHHLLLEVHPSPIPRTHTHRREFLLAWLHRHQPRHIHKDQVMLHLRIILPLHRPLGVIHHKHSHSSSLSSNSHHHNHHSPLQQLKQDFSLHRASQALKGPHQLVLNLSSQVVMDCHHLSLFLPQLRLMCHQVHKVSLSPILHILLDHNIPILHILSKPMDLKLTLPHLHKVAISIHDPLLPRCRLQDHRALHHKVSMELMTRADFPGINHHHSNLKRI